MGPSLAKAEKIKKMWPTQFLLPKLYNYRIKYPGSCGFAGMEPNQLRHGKKTGTTLAGGNTQVDPTGKKAGPTCHLNACG